MRSRRNDDRSCGTVAEGQVGCVAGQSTADPTAFGAGYQAHLQALAGG